MATFVSKWIAGSMLVLSGTLSAALAQAPQTPHPVSIAAEYTYVRANTAPGCACFSLNGGSVQALDRSVQAHRRRRRCHACHAEGHHAGRLRSYATELHLRRALHAYAPCGSQ